MRPLMNKFRFLTVLIMIVIAGATVQIYQIWQVTGVARDAHQNGVQLKNLTQHFCTELNHARQIGNQQLRIPQKRTDLALAQFLQDIAAHTPSQQARDHELALAAKLKLFAAQIEIVEPYTCKF